MSSLLRAPALRDGVKSASIAAVFAVVTGCSGQDSPANPPATGGAPVEAGGASGGIATSGQATLGGAGVAGTAGTAGTAAAGQAGSSAGSETGGAGGGTASAGSGSGNLGGENAAGSQSGGGTSPVDGPQVTAAKARHEHTFRAKDADAGVSFNDNSEVAVIDNRAPTLMGKLVLPFTGVGTNSGTLEAGGEFCARRGFHVLGIAAFQDYDIVSRGADFFGDARRSVFEGVLYTHEGEFAQIAMTKADGVAQRTQKALQYLQAHYPEEGWAYFLKPDGSVRWTDVIFSGFSHGGSNAARFAFLVEAARVVSLSGPRDNLCTRLDLNDCGGVVATWLGETSKTPMDRFFTITGKSDDQHLQHLFAMEKTGYTGAATSVEGAQAPYGNSHRLTANAGHTDFCQSATYQAACNYVFGVPPENQAGTPR